MSELETATKVANLLRVGGCSNVYEQLSETMSVFKLEIAGSHSAADNYLFLFNDMSGVSIQFSRDEEGARALSVGVISSNVVSAIVNKLGHEKTFDMFEEMKAGTPPMDIMDQLCRHVSEQVNDSFKDKAYHSAETVVLGQSAGETP